MQLKFCLMCSQPYFFCPLRSPSVTKLSRVLFTSIPNACPRAQQYLANNHIIKLKEAKKLGVLTKLRKLSLMGNSVSVGGEDSGAAEENGGGKKKKISKFLFSCGYHLRGRTKNK